MHTPHTSERSRRQAPFLVHIGDVPVFGTVPEAIDILQRHGYEVVESPGLTDRQRVLAIVWGDKPFGLAEAKEYPSLKLVARFGTGTDAIDVNALGRHGITIERTPGASTASVAEFALAMIILTLRRVGPHLFSLHSASGLWHPEKRGQDLASATVGILGCGRIGLYTARLLDGLGVRVLAWNRTWPPDPIRGSVPPSVIRIRDLRELATTVDVLSVHVSLAEQTRGMLGEEIFEAIAAAERTLAVVNTARGPVVDEEALLTALNQRIVTAAAVDVWSEEGPGSSAGVIKSLRQHPRVLPTPHLAAYTTEATYRCAILCAKRIVSTLETA